MKDFAQTPRLGAPSAARPANDPSRAAVLGSIPGLERLLPGHYAPGESVRSPYGRWTLPRSFRGHAIRRIVNDTMFG